MVRRAWSFLRSRRAANYLLLYLTVFFIIGTLLPYGGPESDTVRQWAERNPTLNRIVEPLGLHDPYTTPWFIVPALWLALSTCACALERTLGALKVYRERVLITHGIASRLGEHPDARLLAPVGVDAPHEVLEIAERALKGLRMRARRGPVVLTAHAHALGLAGSPLFHVALGLLFVFATAGWLTRFEGGFYAARNRPVRELATSYLPGASKGALFGDRHTGYEFTVTDVIAEHTVDGVVVGTAARLMVKDGDRVLADTLVHTNRPLHIGSMLVHHLKDRIGLAAVLSIEPTGGGAPLENEAFFPKDPADPARIGPWTGEVTLADGRTYPVRLDPRPAEEVTVTVGIPGSVDATSAVLGEGDAMTLPDGSRLRVLDLTRYAEITVVHDWSVPWLYAMFALGSIGVALTVFWPYRRVVLKVETLDASGSDRRSTLSCVVFAQKTDPAFRFRVLDGLQRAGFERIA